jgi:virulence factor Mce-like protein
VNSGRRNSLAASPLLIGAITTLIVVVAVFLSYNANNGLPFVPTYNIKVTLPETSGLQPTNQVRIAGTRVGVVSSLTPHQNPATGRVTATADLKLEKKVEPLPVDTKAIVQSVSAVGLKYLELEKGKSSQTLKPGATIPVSQTREPVDINELFNMFDQKTRVAIQQNTINFGDGVAGRGLGLNNTISTLRPLVTKAIPALRNLAAPKTGLRELFFALDRVASQTAPVAQANANVFSDLDTFFSAFASVAPSLEQTIKGGPAALEQATYSLPYEGPFVEKSAEFMRLLRPTASALRTSAQPLGHAFAVGAVNLSAATALNTQLAAASQAFKEFAQNPVVTLGLEDLTQTATLGNPLVAGLAPEQVTCNYLTLAFRNVASLFSENIGVGSLARVLPVLSPGGVNSEGFPSSAPANGPSIDNGPALFGKPGEVGPPINDNHLHYNPYPNVAGPGQSQECEAGNETYANGQTVIGHVPGNVGTTHEATTREEDLYGQSYSDATLKSLGLETSKEKAAKKKAAKEKAKKEKAKKKQQQKTKGRQK